MKQFLLILVFMIFCSCSQESGTNTETKETIIKEIPADAANVTIINKRVYPLETPLVEKINKFLPKGSLYAGVGNGYVNVNAAQVAQDKINGKLYWENSFTVDSTTQSLDLHSIVGNNKIAMVRLYIKITDYGKLENCSGYSDGIGTAYKIIVSTPGSNFIPQTLTQFYGNQYSCIDVITDSTGKINIKFDVTDPYDAITEATDPGVHIYKWIQGEIWVYCKWDVDVIE
jgi:hypothetical protein